LVALRNIVLHFVAFWRAGCAFERHVKWTNEAQRIENTGMMRLGRPSLPRVAILR
jgi:hypothetical protein